MRGWWRTVAPHRPALMLVSLAVAVLVASGIVVPRVLAAVAEARLAAAIDSEGEAGSDSAASVVLSAELDDFALGADTVDDVTTTLARYPATVDEPLRSALGEPEWILTFPDVTATAVDGSLVRVRLGSAPVFQRQWTVVEGTPPGPADVDAPVEIALEQSVAMRVGASVGTVWQGPDGAFVVTGLIADADGGPSAQGVFHRATSERVSAAVDLVTVGAYVDPASIATLGPRLARAQLVATSPVRAADLRVRDIAGLGKAANKTAAQGTSLASGYPLTVSTRLSAVLERVQGAQDALVSLTALLVAAPFGAAGLVCALAVLAAERRRAGERRLVSARGGSIGRVMGRAAVDASLAAIGGGVLGCAVAFALTPGTTTIPDAAVTGLVFVAVVAAGAALLAAICARQAVAPARVPSVVRIAMDAVVVAVAVVALALLLGRGVPSTGVDPLLSLSVLLVAASAGLVLARALGPLSSPLARTLARTPSLGPSLALSRMARGGGRALQITGVTIAVATATLALGLAQLTGDGISAAASRSVGADVRACGDDGSVAATAGAVAGADGVAAAARVRRLDGIPVTGDGRLRPVEVVSASTADLHRVTPAVPELVDTEPVSAVMSRSAAELLEGPVVVGGREVADVAVVDDDALPSVADAWVLLDDRAADPLAAPVGASCLVIAVTGESTPAAVASRVGEAGTGVEVVDVASETARRCAAPTVSTVLGLLAGAAALAVLTALALSVITEVGAAPERRRTRAVLRAMGSGRVRGLVVVEAVPLAILAALVGWSVGWVGVAAVAGAGGLADGLGIAAQPSTLSFAATAGAAAAIVAVIGAAATITAAMTGGQGAARRKDDEERQ
ncbi:hypothetical protein [Microbacterium testaceum]|uniref:hypothetical protein n=1 Tax=Microbacterium testaceum TaxID=2033 RepID=UPI001246F6FA|nr:hypothetical protein [Microbacterium testaceum]